jgi:hypothetical protein
MLSTAHRHLQRHLRTLNPPLLLALLAVAALAAPTSAPADAGHGSPSHDMGHSGHQMGAAEHGMTRDEHAAHGGGSADQAPAGAHGAHGPAPAHSDEHSASAGHAATHGGGSGHVAMLLAGFAAVNALVLLAAALLRRRPEARKRRETLARVRRAAGDREADPIVETGS